jgi:hypothetical protein
MLYNIYGNQVKVEIDFKRKTFLMDNINGYYDHSSRMDPHFTGNKTIQNALKITKY